MAKLTEEKIQEIKAANGNVPLMGVQEDGSFLVIFKRPSRAEYDRWADTKVAGGSQSDNARQLAQSCLVYPKWDEFKELLDNRPSLLLNECLDVMIELAGVGGDNSKLAAKKL